MLKNKLCAIRNFAGFDLLLVFLLFLMSQPFWMWGMHIQNYLFFPILFIYTIRYFSTPNIPALFFLLLCLVLWQAIQSSSLGDVISAFSLILIFLICKEKSYVLYDKLLTVLAFFIALSLISFVLSNYVGFELPYKIIEPLDGRDYNYKAYWFNIQPNDNSSLLYGPLARFHSIYDEAGNIGSLCAIILYAVNYDLSIWRNRVFFIAGIFSFSFFFILTSLIYFAISKIFSIKKNWPYVLFFIFICVFFYAITKDNPFFEFFVYNRMMVEDGGLAGDNRTDAVFESAFNSFLHSDDILIGHGYGEAAKIAVESSSYKMLLYDYGLIWFAFFIIFWFGTFFLNLRTYKGKIFMLLIFLFMIYQRPGVMSPFLFFVLSKSVFFYQEEDLDKPIEITNFEQLKEV